MKMIVTGSEGFIGKALCQELKRRDVEVIGIDRKNGKDAASICDILKNGDIDCVFHLAAQTSVFNGNIPQIRKDNIDTFINVADACNRYHVKLVYASSSAAHPCNTTSMYPNTSTSSTPHSIAKTRQASGFITCTVPSHVKELFSGFYSIEEKSNCTTTAGISVASPTLMTRYKDSSMPTAHTNALSMWRTCNLSP